LLVIGVGYAGWLALLTVAVLGYDSTLVRNLLSTAAAALTALVGVYLLGIVVDRVAVFTSSALNEKVINTFRRRMIL